MVNHETQNCILFFLNYALILTSDDITLLNISRESDNKPNLFHIHDCIK